MDRWTTVAGLAPLAPVIAGITSALALPLPSALLLGRAHRVGVRW